MPCIVEIFSEWGNLPPINRSWGLRGTSLLSLQKGLSETIPPAPHPLRRTRPSGATYHETTFPLPLSFRNRGKRATRKQGRKSKRDLSSEKIFSGQGTRWTAAQNPHAKQGEWACSRRVQHSEGGRMLSYATTSEPQAAL